MPLILFQLAGRGGQITVKTRKKINPSFSYFANKISIVSSS